MGPTTPRFRVGAGGGTYSFPAHKPQKDETRFRPPTLPELLASLEASRPFSIFGGSCTVVAIRLQTPITNFRLRLVLRSLNLFWRGLHHIVAPRAFNPILVGIVVNLRQLIAKIVMWRRRRGVLHSREVACHGLSGAGLPQKRL